MLILVLESSTSAAKAMLYHDGDGLLEVETEPYLPRYNDNETQDAEGVFAQTAELGRKLAGGKPIELVALCGAWHSLLLCDRAMTPKTRTYSWMYSAPARVARRFRDDKAFTAEYHQSTGCMPNVTYPAFRLIYLREQGIDLSDCLIAGQGSYNFYRLTGRRAVTDTMAAGSGLLNLAGKSYDKRTLDLIGVSESQLGELITYRDTSPLSPGAARLLGLKSGIPVMPAMPDGALNQVGAGALREGVMTFSVGTSAAIRLSSPKPLVAPGTWCYLSPVSYLSGAATAGACNCVDWAKSKFFGDAAGYKEIEAFSADREGLPFFLPFLYGERCPGWNDERNASFCGLKPHHGAADMYLSVQEGVLFNVYQCFEQLCALNGKPAKIKLSGGILNSKRWTQMCCDMFGQEMEISDFKQTSVLGGAILGMDILGLIGDLTNFSPDSGKTVSPDPDMAGFYSKRYGTYKYWYENTL